MQIVPVLDVMNGQVVRGVGGRREEYRPIVSRLANSAEPLTVAQAFRTHFDLNTLYLADLDALMGKPPAEHTYRCLGADGFHLWVDAGVASLDQAKRLTDLGVDTVIAALESLPSPANLVDLVLAFPSGRVVFSLDLKGGNPMTARPAWEKDAWSIARQAHEAGVRRMLVLDLVQVGTGSGVGTEKLCGKIKAAWPEVSLAAGGGIRGKEDLLRLEQCGVDAALVASALHDGQLRKEDWQNR
jgi:phosphoribosylformimino-5-aminoimidazole carboxamide ribotide isomerase